MRDLAVAFSETRHRRYTSVSGYDHDRFKSIALPRLRGDVLDATADLTLFATIGVHKPRP